MQEQFDGWQKRSPPRVAICNDCHTPAALVGKYLDQGDERLPALVRLHRRRLPRADPDRARRTARSPRRRAASCHAAVVELDDARGGEAISCIRCHDSVGHLR